MATMFALYLLFALVSAKQIVVFKTGVSTESQVQHLNQISHLDTFNIGQLNGYVVEDLQNKDSFLQIHKDIIQSIEADVPMYKKALKKPEDSCKTESNTPSWGLKRVSSTKYPLHPYSYPSTSGSADVYVMDTGVRTTHHEFEGRATFAFNAAKGKINTDKDGHGTFVAGVVAAKNYGVCKTCNVISVKIFTDDGDCSASIIIAGFNYIIQQVKSGAHQGKKILINISVGGDPGETSDAMDAAVNELVKLGIHVVGAAGNENVDACTESPARASSIIAVGSTMILVNQDWFLGGSNFGKCVKVFAPGDKIISLGISSDTDVGVMDSGTSFSSPHVAGVLAELTMLYPNASLPVVQSMLLNQTLRGVIGDVPKGTANKMLHHSCASTSGGE